MGKATSPSVSLDWPSLAGGQRGDVKPPPQSERTAWRGWPCGLSMWAPPTHQVRSLTSHGAREGATPGAGMGLSLETKGRCFRANDGARREHRRAGWVPWGVPEGRHRRRGSRLSGQVSEKLILTQRDTADPSQPLSGRCVPVTLGLIYSCHLLLTRRPMQRHALELVISWRDQRVRGQTQI